MTPLPLRLSSHAHLVRDVALPFVVALALAASSLQSALAVDAATAANAEGTLAEREARLAERFERLEVLAERLAELSRTTQPRRAKLLRDVVARSRERDLAGRFAAVVAELDRESYSRALDGQGEVEAELSKLLELMLQEDRDSELDSQRKRVGKYLQELRHVIRLQRGVKGRTEGGDDPAKLADEQAKIAERTGKLGDDVAKTEGGAKDQKTGQVEAKGGSPKPGDPKPGDAKPGEPPREPGTPKSSDPRDPTNGKPADSKPGDSKPSDSKPSEGSPAGGQPSPGQPSSGSGSPSSPSESSSDPQQQSPADRAVEQINRARQQMEQAQEQLKKAQRDGALGEEEDALKALEQAKAELERILRQLREEEMERTLVLLEARFRKMLEAQIEIYEDTKKLDAAAKSAPLHEREMTGGRLSRAEREIEREADRALVLMREDGSSVAFPEAIEQARADMELIATRLGRVDAALITQGLEEDVIATLEETLAALQKALQDLREQRARGGAGQSQAAPGEQPLVEKLAELRMIRSLQAKVNRRTKQYGALVQGEMAVEPDLREALAELADRQQRIYQAAHDLTARED